MSKMSMTKMLKRLECISSGTISQDNIKFSNRRNLQCVCISVCAGAIVQNNSQLTMFTSDDIDKIIEEGDQYYVQTKKLLGLSHIQDLLSPDEVAPILTFCDQSYNINTEWVSSGLYPVNELERCESENFLARIFAEQFEINANCGYIFLTLGSAVSVWMKNNVYFMFNSHSIDKYGNYSENGVGRLFMAKCLEGLACLLLKKCVGDNNSHQYEIHRVCSTKITADSTELSNVVVKVAEETTSSLVLDSELQEIESSVSSMRKRPGRPFKKHTGRPKKSLLTKEEQHQEAVKKYKISNPDIQCKAVKTYHKGHPDVVNKAKKKYAIENPNANREAVKKFRDSHPGCDFPLKLKKNKVGEYCGDQLNVIQVYQLKNPSLRSANCFKCSNCSSPLFEEERHRKQWCCGFGRYNVLNLPPLEEEFYKNKTFLKNARRYNDMFVFCALEIPGGYHHPKKGLSFLKIQGRIYHRVFDLSYKGTQRNSASLYIDDGQERFRQAQNDKLDLKLIKCIQEFLEQNNPYIRWYKQLYNEPSEQAHLIFESTTRRTHGPVLGDTPQSTEVAAVINCDSQPYTPRKLCIWKIGAAKQHYVDVFHPAIEPFQYPLLYPYGTAGWHVNKKDKAGGKLTQLKYIRCLLLSEDRFSKFGSLSDTWLVDMFARIDEERLRFIQFSQNKTPSERGLRVAAVDELSDVLNKKNAMTDVVNDETVQGDGNVVPGRVYLPCTYTGGPRYMRICYLDAMGLVSRLGNPTYFVTFTAFAGWKEIVESKQNIRSEAQVIDRVFQLKLQELLRDIRCGNFFGKLSYIVWVIEFQMRGLPHAHICFRVDGGPIQNYEIDLVVRADIPKENEAEGRLRALVLRHMLHGPCGHGYRTDFPCWDNELQKCTKFFPKPCTETTHTDSKGFVQYKRSENNKATIFLKKIPVEVDDRWVVPYNAALLLKYQCHINIEIASVRRAVKYLFKYISKGSSLRRMTVVEESQQNEVEEYVTKRYIGATDAAWRIFEFNVTGREPTVIVLPVHLEGKHVTIFRQGQEQQALEKATSKLVIYFNRPNVQEMEGITYLDFYEKYIVHSKKPSKSAKVFVHPDGVHFITPRQKGSCIARLFWVAPIHSEQYFLRMLLLRYPCRGFKDLYSMGGPLCCTFQQVAIELGLADNNSEYAEALEEASKFMTANRLRFFFVILSTIGAAVANLWEPFKNLLCEDFLEQLPDDCEMAIKLGLISIDRCLRRHGSSLLEAGLPVVEDNSTELGRERLQYSPSLQKIYVEKWEPRLSPDQLKVLNHMKLLLKNDASDLSRLIFLDGPGGYGKTLLLNVIAAYFRSIGKLVLCVATSGIAALNLNGGITAHSMFRLPLNVDDGRGYWSITNNSQRGQLIKEALVIIFDEAPMAHKHLIEIIERSLRDLMQSEQLFGGKIVIFAGDFRQIPPVVENSRSPSDVINVSIRKSDLWKFLTTFKLTTPHRTCGDNEYAEFLLKLGDNIIPQQVITNGNSKDALVPLENIHYCTSVEDLIKFVFPKEILDNPDECAKRVILSTHNANVKEINEIITSMLVGDYFELFSLDTVVNDGGIEHFDNALLHEAQGKGVPDHILKLKIGSICMIMRNLNFDIGLVNGMKVVIVAISRRLITVRRPGMEEHFAIPRISFKFPIFVNSPIEMLRRQFPLQPCYALSIHKSQGQTIDTVGLDLRSDCFTHGQLYVALSRVRSLDNLLVLIPTFKVIDEVAFAKNIVFQDLVEL